MPYKTTEEILQELELELANYKENAKPNYHTEDAAWELRRLILTRAAIAERENLIAWIKGEQPPQRKNYNTQI